MPFEIGDRFSWLLILLLVASSQYIADAQGAGPGWMICVQT